MMLIVDRFEIWVSIRKIKSKFSLKNLDGEGENVRLYGERISSKSPEILFLVAKFYQGTRTI